MLKPPSWSALLVTMVDRTHYDPASVPELSLRQVFGRQRLSKELCRLMADKKMLTVEGFAMLGDTIAAVKLTLKTIVADDSLLGDTPAAVELALTSLAAVWKTCSIVAPGTLRRSASKNGRGPFESSGDSRGRPCRVS